MSKALARLPSGVLSSWLSAAAKRLCEAAFSDLDHQRGRCNCLLDRAEIYLKLSLDAESRHVAEEAESGFRDLGLTMEAARALFFGGVACLGDQDFEEGQLRLQRA